MSIATQTRLGAAAILITALVFAAPARGAPVVTCVDNDASFKTAALNATLVPTTIELVQGTYHDDGTNFTGTLAHVWRARQCNRKSI